MCIHRTVFCKSFKSSCHIYCISRTPILFFQSLSKYDWQIWNFCILLVALSPAWLWNRLAPRYAFISVNFAKRFPALPYPTINYLGLYLQPQQVFICQRHTKILHLLTAKKCLCHIFLNICLQFSDFHFCLPYCSMLQTEDRDTPSSHAGIFIRLCCL